MNLKITSLNSNDGLPVEQVHNIDMDFTGKLWMATSAGLARYNGVSVSVYDGRTGVDCVGLRTVYVHTNNVWIGTDQGLELLDFDGNKKELSLDFEWKYGIAECIVILNDEVYVGTSNGLLKLLLVEGNYTVAETYNIGYVVSIDKYSDHELLVVSASLGLLKVTRKGVVSFSDELPSDAVINCVKKSFENFILVGTSMGLFVLNGDGQLVNRLSHADYNKKLSKIAIMGSDWWLAFDNTLVLVNEKADELIIEEEYELESKINDIYVDKINNVWVATNNSGLKKITCLRSCLEYVNYGKKGPVYSIKQSNQENAFIISGDGLVSHVNYEPFDSSKTIIESFFKLPTIIWDSCIDPLDSNKIWLATQDGLYVVENGSEPYKFIDNKNLINAPNRVLEVIDNEIWLGTIAGLFRIKDDVVDEILNNNNEAFGYIYTFRLSTENELWIGTLGQGLWHKKGNQLNHITNNVLRPNGNTYSIDINKNGKIVILQNENLIQIDQDGNFELVIQEFPMAGWSVLWISEYEVAIGSNNGIIVVNVNTKTIINRINLYLNKSDWQFTCSRSLFLLEDKYVMCALNGGLHIVDTEKLKEHSVLPEIQLESIDWQNITPSKLSDTYILPTGKWSVNISAYLPWFVDENQINYRFKLVGFDETWSELSSINFTKYNSLPPGQYALQAQAFSPLTGYSEINTLLNMEVSNPWWVKKMAPLIDSGRIFYDKFFKSRVSNKNLLEKNFDLLEEIKSRKIVQLELTKNQNQLEDILENYQETENELQETNTNLRQLTSRLQRIIEEEKKAISREVHDVLGQKLTRLKWDTSWLNTKLKETEPEYAEKAKEMINIIDDTIDTVRKIASELRPSILDDLGLQAAIEWHSKAFQDLTDIKCKVECDGLSENYSEDIVTAVFRIFQESLTNIIRHAKASKVIIRLYEENENILVLEVEDNGLGISKERENNETSLGLMGMRERVSILKGTFFIRKLPTQGTLVKIEIPFTK